MKERKERMKWNKRQEDARQLFQPHQPETFFNHAQIQSMNREKKSEEAESRERGRKTKINFCLI
jgi:hypothetical protein